MDKHEWKEQYLAVRKRPGMYFGDIEHASTEYGKSLLKFIISCQKDSLKTIDLYLSPQGTYELKSDGIDFSMSSPPIGLVAYHHINIVGGSLWCAFRLPNNKLEVLGSSNPPFFIMDVKNWDDDTVFRAQLDPEIFNTDFVSIFPLQGAARALAIAKPGLSVRLSQDGYTSQISFPNGSSDRLLEMNWGHGFPYQPVRLQIGDTQNHLDMAFRVAEHDHNWFETYVNGELVEGGTHIEVFNTHLKARTKLAGNAVFSFWLTKPDFEGPCRDLLNSKLANDLVRRAMEDKLPIAIAKRPELVDIFGKIDFSSNDND